MIFIDCGAHVGQVTREFLAGEFGPTGDKPIVHAFEPNRSLAGVWEKMKSEFPHARIKFHDKAVWVDDTQCQYVNFGTHDTANNMVGRHKIPKFNSTDTYRVDTIDLDRWIVEKLSDVDGIILKMNIEGPELSILPKMIFGGSIFMIDKIIIYWHDIKFDKKKSAIRINLEKWFDKHPEIEAIFKD